MAAKRKPLGYHAVVSNRIFQKKRMFTRVLGFLTHNCRVTSHSTLIDLGLGTSVTMAPGSLRDLSSGLDWTHSIWVKSRLVVANFFGGKNIFEVV